MGCSPARLHKDVVRRKNIRDVDQLERVMAYVLSLDGFDRSRNGILHLDLRDFLLRRE